MLTLPSAEEHEVFSTVGLIFTSKISVQVNTLSSSLTIRKLLRSAQIERFKSYKPKLREKCSKF